MTPTKLLLAAAVLLTACHTSPKNSDYKEALKAVAAAPGMNGGAGRYGLKAIPGWTKKDTSMSGVRFTAVICDTTVGGFRPNVNVVTQTVSVSLDDCFTQSVEGMQHYLHDFKVIGKGSGTLAGQETRWLRYSSSVNGKNTEGKLICLVSGGIAYAVTCTGGYGLYDESADDFDAIVKTFTLE